MVAAPNEEAVESALDRLREEYGDPPVEERTWERPPERFDRLVEYTEDGYVGGAYGWVVRRPEEAAALSESMPAEASDDRERVLMALGRGQDEWGLPGGGLEDGETHEEAVRREVREEAGVECEPVEPFLLRRVTVVPAETDPGGESFAIVSDEEVADGSAVVASDRPDAVHLLYVFFDATYEGGSIAVQPGELDGAAWFAEPPERLMPANRFRAESWDCDAEGSP
jgi:8-oxo-dGTP pyrophosphatase MutT (NUDIX family)